MMQVFRFVLRALRACGGAFAVLVPVVGLSTVFFTEPAASQEIRYGSPLEVGLGVSGQRMQSRPEWAGKHYGTGFVTCGLRLYKGFSIRAGKEYGLGEEPKAEHIPYGDMTLDTKDGTWTDVTFYGIRYDIPVRLLNFDFMAVDMLCVSAGLLETKFGIKSELFRNVEGSGEKVESLRNQRTATVSGQYVDIAARWFIRLPGFSEDESLLGMYGIDFGVRYGRYPRGSVRYDNVMEPASNFNFYQVYLMGFAAIKFFY